MKFFLIFGEQCHIFGFLWIDLTLGYIIHFHFFCATKAYTQKLLFVVYILIRRAVVIFGQFLAADFDSSEDILYIL